MNFQDIFDKCLPILKQYAVLFVVAGCGVMFIAYGLIASFAPSRSANMTFEPVRQVTQSANIQSKKILIDVEGAVLHPGVYTLLSEARVQDALKKSGGLASNADKIWVEKNLNLATKLTDGAKIYIPVLGEVLSGVATSSLAGSVGNMISINTASQVELDTLPGIGLITAEKIISNRPYGALEELVSKKVVSAKVFAGIKDSIEL